MGYFGNYIKKVKDIDHGESISLLVVAGNGNKHCFKVDVPESIKDEIESFLIYNGTPELKLRRK